MRDQMKTHKFFFVAFCIMLCANKSNAKINFYSIHNCIEVKSRPASILQKDKEVKQEAVRLISRSLKRIAELDKYKMELVYRVFYDKKNFSTPDNVAHGTILKFNKNYLQTEVGNVTLYNSDYEVFIKEKSKVIMISERRKKDMSSIDYNLDTLATKISNVYSIDNGFQLHITDGPIKIIDIELNEKTGQIYKWRSHYRHKKDFGEGEKNVVLEIVYKKIEENYSPTSKIFDEKKYLSIDPETFEVKGIGKYENYIVINQLPRK